MFLHLIPLPERLYTQKDLVEVGIRENTVSILIVSLTKVRRRLASAEKSSLSEQAVSHTVSTKSVDIKKMRFMVSKTYAVAYYCHLMENNRPHLAWRTRTYPILFYFYDEKASVAGKTA